MKETHLANIEKAKKDGKLLHVKNFFNTQVSWSDVICILDSASPEDAIPGLDDHRLVKTSQGEQLPILVYNKLDPVTFEISSCNKPDRFSEILSEMRELVTEEAGWFIKNITNFIGKEGPYYAHKDDRDVFLWQAIGSVEYLIYEDDPPHPFSQPYDTQNKSFVKYTSTPSDLLFIPKGVIHQVVVTEPRSTFVLDYRRA